MSQKSSIALGFFDGVHLAHQKIILAAAGAAREKGLRCAALSFDSPPALILWGEAPPCLTDNGEKRRLIEGLGAQCVLLETTRELLSLSGEDFVKSILLEKMNVSHAVCGFNYTFGRDRLGPSDLKELGEKYGFVVKVLEEERMDGSAVSSSRIRSLISQGKMEAAAALLGRPYSIDGTVEPGKRLGRTMGFPTINVYPSAQRAFMPYGVYATKVLFRGEEHIGVTNVGVNPTVHDGNIRIETHIPNYSGNLYGEAVETRFLSFVRPERKFAAVEELFTQIGRDTETVMNMLSQGQTNE
ncbi:MAG: riboflavin biosynthesis protein RibF [Clostridia bacterium]